MPLFWKPYHSDVTRFIAELKAKRPTLEAEQRAGRSIWWDKKVDREAEAEYRAADVPQPPYVYFGRSNASGGAGSAGSSNASVNTGTK